MPSGAKKRKAAKKKKVHDSSATNPHQGENDGGELSSPTPQDPVVEVVKREDSSSEKVLKDANEEEGNVEIESVSKSKNSSSSSSDSSDDESHVVEKKVVVLESAPVESAPAVESLPEKISPIVDPVKPVDSLLEEVSQVFDEIKNEEKKDLVVNEEEKGLVLNEEEKGLVLNEEKKDLVVNEEKKDLVVEETPVVEEQQTVVDCETVVKGIPVVEEELTVVDSETAVKDDFTNTSVVAESVIKENDEEKSQPLDEKASSESTDHVSSSTPPKDVISDISGADRANEIETMEHSDRQAPAAPIPVAVQNTTSWKSCCGIFELFSGSGR